MGLKKYFYLVFVCSIILCCDSEEEGSYIKILPPSNLNAFGAELNAEISVSSLREFEIILRNNGISEKYIMDSLQKVSVVSTGKFSLRINTLVPDYIYSYTIHAETSDAQYLVSEELEFYTPGLSNASISMSPQKGPRGSIITLSGPLNGFDKFEGPFEFRFVDKYGDIQATVTQISFLNNEAFELQVPENLTNETYNLDLAIWQKMGVYKILAEEYWMGNFELICCP